MDSAFYTVYFSSSFSFSKFCYARKHCEVIFCVEFASLSFEFWYTSATPSLTTSLPSFSHHPLYPDVQFKLSATGLMIVTVRRQLECQFLKISEETILKGSQDMEKVFAILLLGSALTPMNLEARQSSTLRLSPELDAPQYLGGKELSGLYILWTIRM
jgi:hypothetical protein